MKNPAAVTKPKRGRPEKGSPAVPSILSIESIAAHGPWRDASVDERKRRRADAVANIEVVGTMRVAALAMGCREDDVPRLYGFRWDADYTLALRRHMDVCYERLVTQAAYGNTTAAIRLVEAQDARFSHKTEHKETIQKTEEVTHRVEGEIRLRPTDELIEFIRGENPALANLLSNPALFAKALEVAAQPEPIIVNAQEPEKLATMEEQGP